MDPDAGDYSLAETSPCIDAGNPDPQFNDPDGTRNDMGALYHPQSLASVEREEPAGRIQTWGRIKRLFH